MNKDQVKGRVEQAKGASLADLREHRVFGGFVDRLARRGLLLACGRGVEAVRFFVGRVDEVLLMR